MKRVTILDVAAAAGVSKSTVSRVLNAGDEAPGATARAIREAAQALGYRRDASAANLRRGRTGMIGLVVTQLSETVRAIFHEEVSKACHRVGRFAIAAAIGAEAGSEREAVELLLRQGADGLILTTASAGDTLADELAARGIPFALALRGDGHSPAALNDDELGGYLATRHLLDLGHRRIAVIGGPAGTSTVRGRVDGHVRALAEAGLAALPELHAPASFGAESGAQAAARLMALPQPPSAIFAVNDTTAIGAFSALSRLGLTVPGDVSLVGFSDIPIVAHLHVPLTTVRVHYDRIAADAVALLCGEGAAAFPRLRITAPTLVLRESTAAPRAA